MLSIPGDKICVLDTHRYFIKDYIVVVREIFSRNSGAWSVYSEFVKNRY